MKWLILCVLIMGCTIMKPDPAWREQKMDAVVQLESDLRTLGAAIQIIGPSLPESDMTKLKRILDWYTTRYYRALVALADDDKSRTEENIDAARKHLIAAAKLIRGYAM